MDEGRSVGPLPFVERGKFVRVQFVSSEWSDQHECPEGLVSDTALKINK